MSSSRKHCGSCFSTFLKIPSGSTVKIFAEKKTFLRCVCWEDEFCQRRIFKKIPSCYLQGFDNSFGTHCRKEVRRNFHYPLIIEKKFFFQKVNFWHFLKILIFHKFYGKWKLKKETKINFLEIKLNSKFELIFEIWNLFQFSNSSLTKIFENFLKNNF